MEEIELGAEDRPVVPGFPGTGASDRPERLASRAALNADDTERALQKMIAFLGGFTVDAQLYRGEIPTALADAACVHLNGELHDSSPDYRSFALRFAGRETTRGSVLSGLFRVLGQLPMRWAVVAGGAEFPSLTVAELKLARPLDIGHAVVNGRHAAVVEAEFHVRVCTALPRGGVTS